VSFFFFSYFFFHVANFFIGHIECYCAILWYGLRIVSKRLGSGGRSAISGLPISSWKMV
jgi:hypothetical protein